MASSLPVELVHEILVRLPVDEPVQLVRASVVCKAWRRALSDDRDAFLRRCHGFHGGPPLLGYIQNHNSDNASTSSIQFVPATASVASAVRMPVATEYSSWVAIDCRHGHVLIHFEDDSKRRLVVWDPITGSQHPLILPSWCRYLSSCPSYNYNYTGAVLCAKDGCDHLDCHGGPFRVVFVENSLFTPIFTSATSYSSLTGVWSAPTRDNSDSVYYRSLGGSKPSLLIGDAIYFPFEYTTNILKYDLCTHRLSEINVPREISRPVLMKTTEDGRLGLATLSDNNCIHIWSRQDVTDDIDGGWVEHRVMEFGTLLPSRVQYKSYQVVGFAEGTNTIFVNISTDIFTIHLKSKEVRKISKRQGNRFDLILPYASFYTPSFATAIP